MEKLTLQDIKDIATYEKERPEFQKHIIALKKRRRVSVGDKVTLLFENRETVRSQIQEMCRVERIVHDDKIQEEIDVYNGLIPEPNHLAATVFVEIIQMDQIRAILDSLIGLDEHVSIQIGKEKILPFLSQGAPEMTGLQRFSMYRSNFHRSKSNCSKMKVSIFI